MPSNKPSSKVLVLRWCKPDMTSKNGFKWPTKGKVACIDWDPKPECGNGLHGWLWGCGDSSVASLAVDNKWLVVEVLAKDIVDLGGKVKFPKGSVVHCGDQISATRYVVDRLPAGTYPVIYSNVVAGDYGTATAGYGGTATAGYGGTATAGNGGTATAGDYGTATAGNGGTATAGDDGAIIFKIYDGGWNIYSASIDGTKYKANTPYHVKNGKITEGKYF